MKTKIILLVLGCVCWEAFTTLAQTNPPAAAAAAAATVTPAAPAAPAAELEPPVLRPTADAATAASAAEVVPLISFDAEFPVLDAVTNLAQQAGITYRIAPELVTNGVPAALLTQPVGMIRYENVTARQALQRLLTQKGLVLGTRAGATAPLLGTLDSGLTPVEPEGGDLARMAPDDQSKIEGFFEQEVPLLSAIHMLAKLAKINVMVDPRLKTGGVRQVGTNIVELPAVATNTVSLSTYGDVQPKQMLDAVLNNYGLTMITDPKTGFSQVTFRDPTAQEPVWPYPIPLRYSNTTNIQTLIQATFPRVKVQSDIRTAQLVVLATQKEYDAITNLVAALDTPTKQVLIEARFLETLANPRSIKGIDWKNTLAAQQFTVGNGLMTPASGSTTTTRSPGNPVTITRPDGTTQTITPGTSRTRETTIDTAFPGNATANGLQNPGLALSTAGGFNPSIAFLNAQGVNAALSFLNEESDTRTLATPRVVTLDNRETRLEVTESIPIFNATEAIGQAGTAVSSSRPEYTNVGTILIVTPRITDTNVALRIQPEISRVVRDHPSSQKIVQGKVNQADVFASSKIDTQVLIPSGNTLVMGGLIQDSTDKTYRKVPFLGDIPVLGWAFRHENKSRSKANLLVFITPTIIEDADFQPYRTDFLNSRMPEHDQTMPEYWNRGKPKEKVDRQQNQQDPRGNAIEPGL
jgi:Flp pilus assembly secretin CpaC